MMKAISASETSVDIYQTTRCYIPEESHFHQTLIGNKHHDTVSQLQVYLSSWQNLPYRSSIPICTMNIFLGSKHARNEMLTSRVQLFRRSDNA
jgi:hypothetical protein